MPVLTVTSVLYSCRFRFGDGISHLAGFNHAWCSELRVLEKATSLLRRYNARSLSPKHYTVSIDLSHAKEKTATLQATPTADFVFENTTVRPGLAPLFLGCPCRNPRNPRVVSDLLLPS